MRIALAFIPIILGLIASGEAAAAEQASSKFTLVAKTVQTPPRIDGTLNDPLWQTAAHVQLDWDITFQRAADETTDAYLLVDAHFLYVAFVAKQKEAIVSYPAHERSIAQQRRRRLGLCLARRRRRQ